MQLGVALGGGVEVGAMQLGGGDLPALEQPGRLLGGQAQRVDAAAHRRTPTPPMGARGPPANSVARNRNA